ncbi:MAG: hypothetical protein ACKV2T_43400 [Kofleriaceae bacterium]
MSRALRRPSSLVVTASFLVTGVVAIVCTWQQDDSVDPLPPVIRDARSSVDLLDVAGLREEPAREADRTMPTPANPEQSVALGQAAEDVAIVVVDSGLPTDADNANGEKVPESEAEVERRFRRELSGTNFVDRITQDRTGPIGDAVRRLQDGTLDPAAYLTGARDYLTRAWLIPDTVSESRGARTGWVAYRTAEGAFSGMRLVTHEREGRVVSVMLFSQLDYRDVSAAGVETRSPQMVLHLTETGGEPVGWSGLLRIDIAAASGEENDKKELQQLARDGFFGRPIRVRVAESISHWWYVVDEERVTRQPRDGRRFDLSAAGASALHEIRVQVDHLLRNGTATESTSGN